MKKTILFVYEGKVRMLPPFMAILDSLLARGNYKIIVISSDVEPEIDELYKNSDIKFIHYYEHKKSPNICLRVYNKLRREYLFYNNVKHDLDSIQYDILWIIHEKTSVKIKKLLSDKKYILSTYELRDDDLKLLEKTRSVTTNAAVNVVCEYNRGQIIRTWFNLSKSPIVLPNKPYKHPRTPMMDCGIQNIDDNKKIILYQGILSKAERDLDVLCETISSMDGYKLALMGGKSSYSDYLVNKYPNVQYLGYFKAPDHLKVTSHAYIGLVAYNYHCLNTIYCAPNKIWEYSGFGIPILGNEIPGLVSTIGTSHCGVCIDTNSKEEIIKAIKQIDNNYDEYHQNALTFYESCNIDSIIDDIIVEYSKS